MVIGTGGNPTARHRLFPMPWVILPTVEMLAPRGIFGPPLDSLAGAACVSEG